MKKTLSYAFSGVQIVSLSCKTTLSLYHTPLLTLSYHWSVYRLANKNPWITRGSVVIVSILSGLFNEKYDLVMNTCFFKRTQFLRLATLRL